MEEQLWPADALDLSCSDEFLIFEFKVRRCSRARSHDWTDCPFAHPGEKARRRDLRRFYYSATPCPEFRKGHCKRGDACEFAHGVFECWLHPARYRTQPCKDGVACTRRVCFFAHSNEQLRPVHAGSPSSLVGHGLHSAFCSPISSPTSTLIGYPQSPDSLSPPTSPAMSPPDSPVDWSNPQPKGSFLYAAPITRSSPSNPLALNCNIPQLHASFGQYCPSFQGQLLVPIHRRPFDKLNSSPWMSILAEEGGNYASLSPIASSPRPKSLLEQVGSNSFLIQAEPVKNGAALPRIPSRPLSLVRIPVHAGWKSLDTATFRALHDMKAEPVAERVESGRDLRAKIFESLTSRKVVNRSSDPDISWVNELVKEELF